MYLERKIDKELLQWKNSATIKPILLRGARQVGKTQSIRNLGTKFKNFIEINFESDKSIHAIFAGNLSAAVIAENIEAIYQKPIIDGDTLLFFDEIQACLPAIQSLRFFYEQMPKLHIIAAGSLLEFALSEIPSYGVGRIQSLFMYPFSFDEYLLAMNENSLYNLKCAANPQNPLQLAVHEKLLLHFKRFLIMGGMPEIIAAYKQTQNLAGSYRLLSDLKNSFVDDFAKYKRLVPSLRISTVFKAVVNQTGNKFVYSNISENDNFKQIKEALELLTQAGLVIPATHTAANGIPLGAEINDKKRKMFLLDTGLYLNILDFNIGSIILTADYNTINKGSLTEMFVGLELLKYAAPYERAALYYWQREEKNSLAEVDYVISKGNQIYPIEVKSGNKGAMQSMQLFLQSKKLSKGIRISQENFSSFDNFDIYPLYAISNIVG